MIVKISKQKYWWVIIWNNIIFHDPPKDQIYFYESINKYDIEDLIPRLENPSYNSNWIQEVKDSNASITSDENAYLELFTDSSLITIDVVELVNKGDNEEDIEGVNEGTREANVFFRLQKLALRDGPSLMAIFLLDYNL